MTGYVVTGDVHSDAGALAAATRIFSDRIPESLLDVGCGGGTWMRAAKSLGVATVVGIDAQRHFSDDGLSGEFRECDLSDGFDLGRTFDAVICLEVAEHLSKNSAEKLVSSLCRHGHRIIFSAACPGQHGQNHINCQWPDYWQALFNRQGFACDDCIRWEIWNDPHIEPWYRQNLFVAQRAPERAGTERRLNAAIHPEMTPFLHLLNRGQVEAGDQALKWYVANLGRALKSRAARLLR